ncbi:TonB-dependent receptor [Paracidobacterium acidisoli]|uniref:TonB-dependent receptor n=1 Tax=Paracidobacterium acidisoli TaxID=2303751 RepID=A0A372IJJ6_9BACT|nr:carboxypeptidase-like regulatory domain-containing protein [Paracidobacterium acidisoli]MBT9333024.1 TonB-dependent receptor [Paracidobacterium acidisoli]
MSRQIHAVYLKCLFSPVLLLAIALPALGQSTATVTGIVQDTSDARIPHANVKLINTQTGTESTSQTNNAGDFALPNVMPGHYTLQIERDGFDTTQLTGITLNVGDNKSVIIRMKVGSKNETVTVDGRGLTINTTDASVSTVIDRKFVENTPLNGRSFQSLILLTPGSVTNTPQQAASIGNSGEFSINGQRTESNYYTVDGVSANAGIAVGVGGGGTSGSLPASTALGTTQALVSVDALQEFRVESSTYSAEYGRNPGGQFSMVTRSGANDLHGSLFDYFRNDALDANNWFNDNTDPITRRTAEHQNDFGGTLGGPIRLGKLYNGTNKSFFFVSYEGLRLLEPVAASINPVPDAALRQSAVGLMQNVLNAFPKPTMSTDLTPGLAAFVGSWSNPSQEDATSIRVDHSLGSRDHLFFRFSDTPSNSSTRGTSTNSSPSVVSTYQYATKTYTFGNTFVLKPWLTTETRLNFSSNNVTAHETNDNFGGAVPVDLAALEGISTDSQSQVALVIGGYDPTLIQLYATSQQQQWNVVQTLIAQRGRHTIKVGIDWRRVAPFANVGSPSAAYYFYSPTTAANNSVDIGLGESSAKFYPVYMNFSVFVQDEWRISQRLSLSGGIRWDVNPAPGVRQGLMPYTVKGLSNLSTMTLAPQGTPLWSTAWYNFAPRLGVAYTLDTVPAHLTVLRAGAGVFFDTGQQVGSAGYSGVGLSARNYFGSEFGTTAAFPAPVSEVTPAINPPTPTYSTVYTNPANLQVPYTYQWNVSLEQALGNLQSLTMSYVGSNGRKLLQETELSVGALNPSFSSLVVYTNGLTSNYNALQVQFKRQVSHGLQALASYTWSHSLDYGSYNTDFPYQYGNSDFDVRHNATGALSYDIGGLKGKSWQHMLSSGWGLDGRFTARTGFPVTLEGNSSFDPVTQELYFGGLDRVPNVPVYISGTTIYGKQRINPLAFTVPADGVVGNAPRNFVTGFGAVQTDLAVRRSFSIFERLNGQFRIEAFNLLNHPNFGIIGSTCSYSEGPCTNVQFGQATATLSQSLGGLSPIYQMGGPRSLQASLRLSF